MSDANPDTPNDRDKVMRHRNRSPFRFDIPFPLCDEFAVAVSPKFYSPIDKTLLAAPRSHNAAAAMVRSRRDAKLTSACGDGIDRTETEVFRRDRGVGEGSLT